MVKPQLIDPLPKSTPSESGASRGGPRPLPPDLLREASARLGVMALLGAVLWVTGTVFYHLAVRRMTHGAVAWNQPQMMDLVAGVSVVTAILLFWYTRGRDRDPRTVLDVGLWYLLFTGLGIGIVWHWEHYPANLPLQPIISWIGVVVVMFAAVVPSTPNKILLFGFLAVSMNPIGMVLSRAEGRWMFGSLGDVVLMHYPDYMLVGVAAVICQVMTRLGHHVAKAREMGSYEVGELLGRGGMGEVYRATHRMLARPAAIKLIRPEMLGGVTVEAAELAVKRFRREAQAAANLRSPHTVELYDFGVTDDQTLYFVMELLDGMTLDELVTRTGPVPAGRAIHILRQVCDSLEEAHAAGLVHRDIKPANIHLGRLGLVHDFVKVLDFGLVKSVAPDAPAHTAATAAGLTPGTPAFMAPEMALGEQIDARADLYALGCVGYFLVTGQPVFSGENSLQVMAKHLNTTPVPPSALVPGLPERLETVLLACLAKKPEHRPATAAELAGLLDQVEVERWTEAQAAAWWREHGKAAASTR